MKRREWNALSKRDKAKVVDLLRRKTIAKVLAYAWEHEDSLLLEMVGFHTAHAAVTADMARAAIAAVVPMLDNDKLRLLLRHVNELTEVRP